MKKFALKILTTSALAGALTLMGLAVAIPASAMPVAAVTDVSASASPIEQARLHRGFRHRPAFGARRGWHRGWHRGYRRGGPIRRLLRNL